MKDRNCCMNCYYFVLDMQNEWDEEIEAWCMFNPRWRILNPPAEGLSCKRWELFDAGLSEAERHEEYRKWAVKALDLGNLKRKASW